MGTTDGAEVSVDTDCNTTVGAEIIKPPTMLWQLDAGLEQAASKSRANSPVLALAFKAAVNWLNIMLTVAFVPALLNLHMIEYVIDICFELAAVISVDIDA